MLSRSSTGVLSEDCKADPPFFLDPLESFDEAKLDEFFYSDDDDSVSSSGIIKSEDDFFAGSGQIRIDDYYSEYAHNWGGPAEMLSLRNDMLSATAFSGKTAVAEVSLASSSSLKRSYSDSITNSGSEKEDEEPPPKKKTNRKNGALSEARWRAERLESNDPTMPEKRPVGISLASGSSSGWRLRISGTQLGHYATAQQAWQAYPRNGKAIPLQRHPHKLPSQKTNKLLSPPTHLIPFPPPIINHHF